MASLVVNVPVAVPPGPKGGLWNITSTNWKTWSAAASRPPVAKASATAHMLRIVLTFIRIFIGHPPGLAGPAGAAPAGRPRSRGGARAADARPGGPSIRLGMGPFQP